MKAMIRVKVDYDDTHKIIQLFKDVAEELLIMNDGYKGKIKYIRLFDTIYDAAEYLNTTPEVIKDVLEHKAYFKTPKVKYILSRKWLR